MLRLAVGFDFVVSGFVRVLVFARVLVFSWGVCVPRWVLGLAVGFDLLIQTS